MFFFKTSHFQLSVIIDTKYSKFHTHTFAKQSDDPQVYNQPVVEKVTRHQQASVARAAVLGWSSVGLDSMVGMLLFPRSVELYRFPRKK